VARSKTTLKVIGGSTAGALLVAMAAAGAADTAVAAPSRASMVDSALYAQTLDGQTQDNPTDNKISTTVGKAVSVTTKPDGTPTLKALVTNTQVSGKGQGTLVVPIGTNNGKNTGSFAAVKTENDSFVYDINSDGSQVQNLHGSGGAYEGPVAVTMKVNAWLDGKPISPNDMSDITGNVKIDYVFTNHTTQQQEVTYVNTKGEQATAKVDIPVPMGAAFAAVYPNGWADIDAPWADTGFTPAGEQLTGSAVLFPPLGKTTSTLSLTARAEHATLPGSASTAIPVDLGSFAGGLVLNGGNLAENVGEKGANLVASVPGLLSFLQQLLAQYAGQIANVDARYVAPLVDTVEKITINPQQADRRLSKAQASTLALGQLMRFNSIADSWNANLLGGLAQRLNNSSKPVGKLQAAVQGIIDDLPQLNKDIKVLLDVLGNQADLDQATADMPNLETACTGAQATNSYYGSNKTALKNYANAQPEPTKTQLNGLISALGSQNSFAAALDWPACTTLTSTVGPILPKVSELETALKKVKNLIPALQFVVLPKIITELDKVAPALAKVAKKIDNPNCPKTIAAVKQQGIKNCGAVQALDLLATVNRLVGSLMTDKIAPIFAKLQKAVPGLAAVDEVAKVKVAALGDAVAAVPGELDNYSALFGDFISPANAASGKVNNLADQLSILNASLVAMNERAATGQGAPYGPATGVGNPKTLGAWQTVQTGAAPLKANATTGILISLVLFVLTATVGTILYVHRKP